VAMVTSSSLYVGGPCSVFTSVCGAYFYMFLFIYFGIVVFKWVFPNIYCKLFGKLNQCWIFKYIYIYTS
jgi:hypothetical protein